MSAHSLAERISSDSFLEYAFLRWVLTPATDPGIVEHVRPQSPVLINGHTYRLDYEIIGASVRIAAELDGFAFHSDRSAFTYDRLRQNDIAATGRVIVRFSYDAIRTDTARCVAQLQAVLATDPQLRGLLRPSPVIETPDMDPDPVAALGPSPHPRPLPPRGERPRPARKDPVTAEPRDPAGPFDAPSYFDTVRAGLNLKVLRACQQEAFAALGNYWGANPAGTGTAATVMSVGAGKTVLGVAATLAYARRRALVVTPGSVIRGTFDRALNATALGNALYGLPAGPLIPGQQPPKALVLDRADGALRHQTRADLLDADIIVTNFHTLGTGEHPDDLLAKLAPGDIDLIVVDEAHIAAAASYQRLFAHFTHARTLLMSACFTRADGKPIDADVVYRYRLVDSIADGNAKNLRVHRFTPHAQQSTYELVHSDGRREEIVGRDALLAVLADERALARITAKSIQPLHRLMADVARVLGAQRDLLHPVKPRALFATLGLAHAEQVAAIANSHGIATGVMHYLLGESANAKVRARFESDTSDLDAIAQVRMLGQGYDFPPVCVIAPVRPYGSFGEFYQFLGRGIRVINHPALAGRIEPEHQYLDLVLHAELGLDEHLNTIYLENDMDPVGAIPEDSTHPNPPDSFVEDQVADTVRGDGARTDAFVLYEHGEVHTRVVHDSARVASARDAREQQALAARYARYAATTATPVSFEQYTTVLRAMHQ